MVERELEVVGPYDFRATLQIHQLGARDPTIRIDHDQIVKALDGPAGPVTLSATWRSPRIRVRLDGPGAAWLEPRLPAFFGLHDPPFPGPPPGPAHALWLGHRGLRLARAPDLAERHAGFVLQQRVTFGEAARAWRGAHALHGAEAPGAPALRVPLDAARWRRFTAAEAGRLGIDLKRWTALQEAARAAHHVRAADDHARLRAVLDVIPGTGPWTRECVLGFGAGDADAVPLGDVHLAPMVTQRFEGRPQASDARMLELLEPFRPDRHRVLRWLVQPRYGSLASGA